MRRSDVGGIGDCCGQENCNHSSDISSRKKLRRTQPQIDHFLIQLWFYREPSKLYKARIALKRSSAKVHDQSRSDNTLRYNVEFRVEPSLVPN